MSAAHDTLGRAYYGQGNLGSAVEHFEHALKLNRQLGERYFESETLTRLGDAYSAQGDRGAACQVWELAREILEHLNHPGASALGTKLDDLRNWPSRHGAAPPAR